ncbi:hypothetical protein [Clostridium sp. YIM B02506]|uniref:hypothetical protein n=1 Tax=Clostridium sp. YIM B02506 TaxID=2910680 RepID=UPI001EEE2CCF|nr:hypothetical protein [Clostridium sp. YIM B02506]
MKFKNKKRFIPSIVLIGLIFLYLPYKMQKSEYIIFGAISFIVCLIFYLFAIFEYFKVEKDKIVYVNPLRRIRKEIPWNEVIRIYVLNPKGIFKAARIGYGIFGGKEITINAGLKDYKKLIKMVLDKVEGNEKVSIDVRIDDFIK